MELASQQMNSCKADLLSLSTSNLSNRKHPQFQRNPVPHPVPRCISQACRPLMPAVHVIILQSSPHRHPLQLVNVEA
jgi:hypothetical protein